MAAAAKHLTPVTLELGGKSPAIIDSHCGPSDLNIAARRVAWGKLFNAGQTCIAPDYALVYAPFAREFARLVGECVVEFYGGDAQKSQDFPRIVDSRHWNRLNDLLERTRKEEGAEIVFGGKVDGKDLYIEPTVVVLKGLEGVDKNALMESELFGPIL